ncbi:MAG TPA: lysylphosphatidylglycerol synthase domain-containing protein [Hyphomonadaceae bacterium]|jgi:uncharacterized membrane protein YbhN (UPF0104 family)
MRHALVNAAKILVALVFAGIAIHVLIGEFGLLSADEVMASLAEIGWGAAGLMLLATFIAYAAVSTYDAFALRYAGISLSLRKSTISSTSSYAISNLLGFPVFTGNAVRYWLFESWGLGAKETALAALVTTVACNHSLAIIAGFSLLLDPALIEITGLDPAWGMPIGVVLLAISAALILFALYGQREIRIWQLHVNRPGPTLLVQLVVCTIDYAATATVLYIPIGHLFGMDLLSFIALFSIAKTIGIFSNVPGGLGVFEAIIATAVTDVSVADLAAALIAYRVIFYLVPFGIAGGALAVHGLRVASRRNGPRQPLTPSDEKAGR